jgi:hypothetical protein
MKKDKKFKWTTKCQEAFDTMKKQFTEEPVSLMPDQSKLSLTHRRWQLVWYLPNWILMATDTLLHFCQKLSLKPKESMKSMIENY